MKNLLFILSFSLITLFSCSSKDDNINDNRVLLKKWYLYSSTFEGVDYPHDGCSNGNRDYIEFSEPNIVEFYHYLGSSNCDYTLDASGTWDRNGNTIVIRYSPTWSEDLTIVELNNTIFNYTTENGANYSYKSYY